MLTQSRIGVASVLLGVACATAPGAESKDAASVHIELADRSGHRLVGSVEIVDAETMRVGERFAVQHEAEVRLEDAVSVLRISADGHHPIHAWVTPETSQLEVRLAPLDRPYDPAVPPRVRAGKPACGDRTLSVALAEFSSYWAELELRAMEPDASTSDSVNWAKYRRAEDESDWSRRRAWMASMRDRCATETWPNDATALYFGAHAPPASADCELARAALDLPAVPLADRVTKSWRAHAAEAARACGLEISPLLAPDDGEGISTLVVRLRYAHRRGDAAQAKLLRDRIVARLGDGRLASDHVNELLAEYGPLVAGNPLPSVQLTWLGSAETFDPAGEHERWTLILLWAPWCPACREHLPALDRLARSRPDLEVLGISLADADSTRKYLDEHELAGIHAAWIPRPARRSFRDAFQVWSTGTLVLVAPSGVIAKNAPQLPLAHAVENVVAAIDDGD